MVQIATPDGFRSASAAIRRKSTGIHSRHEDASIRPTTGPTASRSIPTIRRPAGRRMDRTELTASESTGAADPQSVGRDDNRGTICVGDRDLQDCTESWSVGVAGHNLR